MTSEWLSLEDIDNLVGEKFAESNPVLLKYLLYEVITIFRWLNLNKLSMLYNVSLSEKIYRRFYLNISYFRLANS